MGLRCSELAVRAHRRLCAKANILCTHVEIGYWARQPPIVGPGTTAERRFSAAGVSEYRVLFYGSRCCQPPCDASAQSRRAQIWSHQELARARRLCYYL